MSLKNGKFLNLKEKQIAVALRYDQMENDAPVVTALGSAETAEIMKKIARRYGVPVTTTKAVANKLAQVKVNQPIPSELYTDVAKILRNKGRGK